jgi:hypothetical protein
MTPPISKIILLYEKRPGYLFLYKDWPLMANSFYDSFIMQEEQ